MHAPSLPPLLLHSLTIKREAKGVKLNFNDIKVSIMASVSYVYFPYISHSPEEACCSNHHHNINSLLPVWTQQIKSYDAFTPVYSGMLCIRVWRSWPCNQTLTAVRWGGLRVPDIKLHVGYHREIRSGDSWLVTKSYYGYVCLHSVTARMAAHQNEHRCAYLSLLSQSVHLPHSITVDFVILASQSAASGHA